MDNLPKDPPDENNNNPTPPPFGTNFNPHSNPLDPNNPYSSQSPQNPVSEVPNPPNYPNLPDHPDNPHHSTYSEVAQHKLRDSHGRFETDRVSENPDQTTLTSSTSLNSFSITNIFKKVFDVLNKIKWKKMTLYLTGAATFIYLVISNPTFQNLVNHFFPNSSPILGRAISFQGVLKSSESGIFSLVLPDQQTYTLHFKPSSSLTNLKKLNEVVVKGNLTGTPYVIENAEIYPLNLTTDNTQNTPTSLNSPTTPNSSNPSSFSNPSDLPKLYPNLTWEITQSKTLLFTSGKRRIEQEGVYLESSQVTELPQDFINYYTNQLTNLGFKQTLNSSDPNSTTITYSKDDLFLTFGVKNIYSGSGDNKKIVGYKAFIEHN